MYNVIDNEGIKINIQPTGTKLNDYLLRKIRNMIKKSKNLFPGINWMDVYLNENDDPVNPRRLVIRFGVPGPDIVVSDSGSRWKTLIRNAEKRMSRQLEKRKLDLTRGRDRF